MYHFLKKMSMLPLLLLLSTAGSLHAQGPWRDARTGTAGVRLDGGTSWSFGTPVANTVAKQPNLVQPFAGAGVIYNALPWLRVGADYSYTQLVREQIFTSVPALSGSGTSPASSGGDVYRDFKTRFHGASLTGEFNLLAAFGSKGSGRFALWAGTGVGCLFAQGNTWTLSVSNEIRNDTWTQTIHFGGHNEPHRYNALFIPATLSLEYFFLPQVALSLGGGYRFLPAKSDVAPGSQAYAKAGLVFNLTGKGIRVE